MGERYNVPTKSTKIIMNHSDEMEKEDRCLCHSISSNPFHGVLKVGEVVDTERDPTGSHRGAGNLQGFLDPLHGQELYGKLLVTQQVSSVLKDDSTKK